MAESQSRVMVGPMQFRVKLRADGTWQWRLRNQQGEVVAQCPHPYATQTDCLAAIDEVKRSAGAIVLEATSL